MGDDDEVGEDKSTDKQKHLYFPAFSHNVSAWLALP